MGFDVGVVGGFVIGHLGAGLSGKLASGSTVDGGGGGMERAGSVVVTSRAAGGVGAEWESGVAWQRTMVPREPTRWTWCMWDLALLCWSPIKRTKLTALALVTAKRTTAP